MIGKTHLCRNALLRGLLCRFVAIHFAPLILFVLGLCANLTSARASLLSSESFDYSPIGSDVNGKNGGVGWNSPWQPGAFNAGIVNNYDIGNGTLLSPLLPGEAGNRAATLAQNAISGLVRDFDAGATVLSTDSATRYLSVLLRPEGALNAGQFNGFFGVYLRGTTRDIFIGKPGGGALGTYVVEERGGGFQTLATGSPAVVLDQTALLVLRADLNNGLDSFRLVVNPTDPISTIPPPLFLDIGTITGIALYSTGAHSADEIRWGDTFESVVPEPGLMGLGLPLIFLAVGASRYRRKRSS